MQPFHNKKLAFLLRLLSPIPHGSYILKSFTVQIQSKFSKIRYSLDPVQSKSSPMLISIV